MSHFLKPPAWPITECWVETGAFQGESIARALEFDYARLHSIEWDDSLYRACVAAFADQPRVQLHHGSSPQVLRRILDPKVATTFWLDAHYSGPQLPMFDPSVGQCPLLEELRVIASVPWKRRPFLLIDDAFLFGPELWSGERPEIFVPDGFCREQWPVLHQIRDLLPDYCLETVGPHLRCTPRESAPSIRCFEANTYSIDGADGILAELIRRVVPARPARAVEVGCHCRNGNCYLLARQPDWEVVFVDAVPEHLGQLLQSIHGATVAFKCCRATVANINQLVPAQTDLLSIDVDGNDYWLWEAVRARPALVVIEFNAAYPPPQRAVMPYDADHMFDHTDYFGASLQALVELGQRKGYAFVGSDSHQSNAYFVRSDLAHGFPETNPLSSWHEPPRKPAVSGKRLPFLE